MSIGKGWPVVALAGAALLALHTGGCDPCSNVQIVCLCVDGRTPSDSCAPKIDDGGTSETCDTLCAPYGGGGVLVDAGPQPGGVTITAAATSSSSSSSGTSTSSSSGGTSSSTSGGATTGSGSTASSSSGSSSSGS